MTPMQMSQFEFKFLYQSRNAAEHKKLPDYTPYSKEFRSGAFWSFRAGYKKSYYAWMYGSFSESLTWNDFFNCYLMGGEL